MHRVKLPHSMPHAWLAAEQPPLTGDPELTESDDQEEELYEATIIRLDASAVEALFQKARA